MSFYNFRFRIIFVLLFIYLIPSQAQENQPIAQNPDSPSSIENTPPTPNPVPSQALSSSTKPVSSNDSAFPISKLSYSKNSFKKHNWGFGAGFISGVGPTYRHWFSNGKGYQLTVLPGISVEENRTEYGIILGALGLNSMRDFPSSGKGAYKGSNLFTYYGGNLRSSYTKDKNEVCAYFDSRSTCSIDNSNSTEHVLQAGLGGGFELHFWQFTWTLMAGYSTKYNYYEVNGKREDPNFSLHPSVETGLFYSF